MKRYTPTDKPAALLTPEERNAIAADLADDMAAKWAELEKQPNPFFAALKQAEK